MTFQIDSFRVAASVVCARGGVDLGGLPAAGLLELSGEVARARRDLDVLMAQVASEIRRRSETVDGVGFAVTQGFRSAGELIAQVTGGSVAEAKRLIATGDLLADVAGDDGRVGLGVGARQEDVQATPLEVFRADLATVVKEGRVSVDVAALFTSAAAAVPDVDRSADLFRRALVKAEGLPLHKVRKLVWQAQAFSDPSAWEVREDRQHEARSVTVRDDVDGMVTVLARLTPLMAAPIRAVLDAGVRSAMRARRDHPDGDVRTPWQMRADILVDLCRHALDCREVTSGVKTTVVIRMTLAELESRFGVGEIDGMPQPVSAGALRRAAADAHIIPLILGGESEVLDLGRSRRLFTPEQRLALVERDGGCAWCNAPPSWCDAHHILWWERDTGPTNLDNGVLMCSNCHHRIHRDGWNIEVENQVVHFIPPPTIDPTRTPHTGGRHRYNLAA